MHGLYVKAFASAAQLTFYVQGITQVNLLQLLAEPDAEKIDKLLADRAE
jgi:hypothetical protein